MLYQESVSQHFLSQTRSATHCESGPTSDQVHQLSSTTDLVGYILISLKDKNIWISAVAWGEGGRAGIQTEPESGWKHWIKCLKVWCL